MTSTPSYSGTGVHRAGTQVRAVPAVLMPGFAVTALAAAHAVGQYGRISAIMRTARSRSSAG